RFHQWAVGRDVVGIEGHGVHGGGARGPKRLPLVVEPLRISGRQHHRRVGCKQDGELGADFAAAAKDRDELSIRVVHAWRLSPSLAWLPMANPSTTRLTNEALAFLTERHLAMLTTLRADNSPHVVAVGFTFDPKTHIARVITSGGSQKAVNAERGGVAVLSQVDGARWLSLEGRASVSTETTAVRDAELRYAQRYRTPRANPKRVVIEVQIERVLGSSDLLDRA